MKKIFISILVCVMVVLALCFTACDYTKSETVLEFTIRNSEGSEEKDIFFNEDYESVTLNAKFEIKDGTAKMQIFDEQNNQVVWKKTSDKTENFDIELKDVNANTEYVFRLETDQSEYVHLLITSSVKLVKNKEKPEIK